MAMRGAGLPTGWGILADEPLRVGNGTDSMRLINRCWCRQKRNPLHENSALTGESGGGIFKAERVWITVAAVERRETAPPHTSRTAGVLKATVKRIAEQELGRAC